MSGRPYIILGGGGHAKVLYWALIDSAKQVLGFIDREAKDALILGTGLRYLGNDDDLKRYPPSEVFLVNGIGSVKNTKPRQDIYNRFREMGFEFPAVVHPSAIIGKDCSLGMGSQIMAGVVIQTGCKIGENCIVNTRACIDHDCVIGDHSHIASGAVISGHVETGSGVHIGAGATVIQCLKVGSHSVVGAGSVVIRNVAENIVVAGTPARTIRQS